MTLKTTKEQRDEFVDRWMRSIEKINDLDKEITDLRAKLTHLEWQPIETAPTDGSHVQLYRPETQCVGYYGGPESGWCINAIGLPAMWPLPTHWAPLREHPNAVLSGAATETPTECGASPRPPRTHS